MAELVTLSVDAMGGDSAPDVVLEGTAQALAADADLHVILCGPAELVEPFAAAHERCVAQATTEVIEMGEHPAKAVRSKKDSSIVVGCRLVKEGRAQGFFSAGSTGACLSAATLVMGRVKGVKRPALGQVLPSYKHPTLLMDVGANADCKPEYLVQFAQMGVVYMREIMGVASPRVGLLNIGSEETKGDAFAQETFEALKKAIPEFVGNCEGGDLLMGEFDVVVTDGFTGNVCLKTLEGTSKVIFKYLKDAFFSSTKSKLGAVLLKDSFSELKSELSPDTYGGTPLLGVKGACIVGHGSSNALAIRNGILAGAATVRSHASQLIADAVARPSLVDKAQGLVASVTEGKAAGAAPVAVDASSADAQGGER